MKRSLVFVFLLSLLVLFVFAGRPKEKEQSANDVVNPRHPSGPRPDPLPTRAAKSFKRKFDDLGEELRDKSKKRKLTGFGEGRDKENDVELALRVSDIPVLEKKWNAVLDFRITQAKSWLGQVSNDQADAIGEKWNVGTGKTVRRLAERAAKISSLVRKEGSGSPRVVTGRLDVQQFFADQATEWDHTFTYEAMADAIKNEFDVGSKKSVKALMDHLEYRKSRGQVKPL